MKRLKYHSGVDQTKLHLLFPDLLKGKARILCKADPSQFDEWEASLEVLRREFVDPRDDGLVMGDLYRRNQDDNETFDEYLVAVQNMASKLSKERPEAELVDIVCGNVSSHIQKVLSKRREPVKTFQDLRKIAHECERFQKNEDRRRRHKGFRSAYERSLSPETFSESSNRSSSRDRSPEGRKSERYRDDRDKYRSRSNSPNSGKESPHLRKKVGFQDPLDYVDIQALDLGRTKNVGRGAELPYGPNQCRKCHQIGHWQLDCPNKTKRPKSCNVCEAPDCTMFTCSNRKDALHQAAIAALGAKIQQSQLPANVPESWENRERPIQPPSSQNSSGRQSPKLPDQNAKKDFQSGSE